MHIDKFQIIGPCMNYTLPNLLHLHMNLNFGMYNLLFMNVKTKSTLIARENFGIGQQINILIARENNGIETINI